MVKRYFKILVLVQLESINSFQPIVFCDLLDSIQLSPVNHRIPLSKRKKEPKIGLKSGGNDSTSELIKICSPDFYFYLISGKKRRFLELATSLLPCQVKG